MANYLFAKNCHRNFLVMKNVQPIRALLGMNQNDMALLLGVSRSHYAMFEIGKRDLPLKATQLLAEILNHMQSPAKSLAARPIERQIATEKNLRLEEFLRENEYQQLLTAKKMAALHRKYEKQAKAMQVMEFLKDRATKNGKSVRVVNSVTHKISENTTADYVRTLAKIELEQEMLIIQKSVLESKLMNRNKEADSAIS